MPVLDDAEFGPLKPLYYVTPDLIRGLRLCRYDHCIPIGPPHGSRIKCGMT